MKASQSLSLRHSPVSWLCLMIFITASLLPGHLEAKSKRKEAPRVPRITIYPEKSTCEIDYLKIYGVAGKQFSAYVPVSPNTVTWFVNGLAGGNEKFGTITKDGLYVPPVQIPNPNIVVISAQSTARPTVMGFSLLTITRNVPNLWGVSPAQLVSGDYEVTLNGSNFAPDSVVVANGAEVTTTYVSPTSLVAKGSAKEGALVFQVKQPGLGGVTGNSFKVLVKSMPVTVAVRPGTANVELGGSMTFAAKVEGSSNKAVTWSVNGMQGGSSATGTISATGVYTAPSVLPDSATLTITAVSAANPASSGQAVVTLVKPAPLVVKVSVSPSATSMSWGGTQTFTATVKNATNTAVTWSVNGTAGGSPEFGTITPEGVYTAPTTAGAAISVKIRATSVENPSISGSALVTFTSPPPPPAWVSGARFLDQSSFGPSPASLAKLKQIGVNAYLDEQFSLPETPIFVPTNNSMDDLQQWVLYNYTTAPDQLRQRVAYALGQIIVTSSNKLNYSEEIIPWMRILSKNAFGNYRTLLREVSVSPSMGKYLDLANSMKPGMEGGANENYAREIMQLFTIGLWKLNQDGSMTLDGAGRPIPTYNQFTVQQISLAFTGWTYATAPGKKPGYVNWEYFGAPMETRPAIHATGQKSVLGVTIPAGQSVEQDLDSVIDILFNHPNTPPFIATRLIRSLVMSNPSPEYITRVANVFANNGSGVRGDLKAVVTAILLDPEARNDVPTVNGGRLKEPILQISGFLRALNGAYLPTQQVTYIYESLAQMPLGPPSVFNWFSPLYRIPNSSLLGPEFQIYSPSEATLRGNFIYWLLTEGKGTVLLDLSPFQTFGDDMSGLADAVNQVLLNGRMDAAMKQILINAASPGYDAKTRIQTMLYLAALSGQYAVQY